MPLPLAPLSRPRELAIVLVPGHQGPNRKRSSAGQDRVPATEVDAILNDAIPRVRDAESIPILGPGEAKGEFVKRLQSEDLGGRIVGVETVDKMTDRQIAARVR